MGGGWGEAGKGGSQCTDRRTRRGHVAQPKQPIDRDIPTDLFAGAACACCHAGGRHVFLSSPSGTASIFEDGLQARRLAPRSPRVHDDFCREARVCPNYVTLIMFPYYFHSLPVCLHGGAACRLSFPPPSSLLPPSRFLPSLPDCRLQFKAPFQLPGLTALQPS